MLKPDSKSSPFNHQYSNDHFMRYVFLLYLSFTYTTGFAQDTAHNKKLQYFGLHQVGLLTGSSTEKFGILTTNGVRFGNWYAGISTGIDWYGIRSIPLLTSVHKAFGKGRNQPFVYGNVGVGFPWQSDYEEGQIRYDYKKGFVAEAGIGYFINLKNKTALSLSAGFSYKELGLDESVLIIPIIPPSFYKYYYEKYYYRRLAIRLGIKI